MYALPWVVTTELLHICVGQVRLCQVRLGQVVLCYRKLRQLNCSISVYNVRYTFVRMYIHAEKPIFFKYINYEKTSMLRNLVISIACRFPDTNDFGPPYNRNIPAIQMDIRITKQVYTDTPALSNTMLFLPIINGGRGPAYE